MKTKMTMAAILVSIVVLLFAVTSALATVTVECKERFHQNKFVEGATDLHFKAWQEEDNIEIVGWTVTVRYVPTDSVITKRGDQPEPAHSERKTTNGSSGPADNGRHAIDIDIKFSNPIPYCTWVEVDVTLVLTSWNTQRIADEEWTREENREKAAPNHGWYLTPPREEPQFPGQWVHTFKFDNDDTTDTFVLKNLKLAVRPSPIVLDSLPSFTDWDTIVVDTAGIEMQAQDELYWFILGPEGSEPDSQHVWGTYQVWSSSKQDMLVASYFDHYAFLSVKLANFEAQGNDGSVELTWTTAAEVDNAGFNVHRSQLKDGPYAQINDQLIEAQGSAIEGASYSFTDDDVVNGVTYYYRLEDIDIHGRSTMHGPVSATPEPSFVDEGEQLSLPTSFGLAQNYPNPFNPTTEIRYDLPVDCRVKLEVYNTAGQKVATLVDEHQQAGSKTILWDSREIDEISSGIYLYRIQAGAYTATRKMVLLR